jgi:hypothetical protein
MFVGKKVVALFLLRRWIWKAVVLVLGELLAHSHEQRRLVVCSVLVRRALLVTRAVAPATKASVPRPTPSEE